MEENKNIGATMIYRDAPMEGLYIFVIGPISGINEISKSVLDWHTSEGEAKAGYLTLEEISNQIKAKMGGECPVLYVWTERPLHGKIYQYGNYYPERWELYGTTKGFA